MLNNKRPHNLFKYQIRELAQGRFAFMNFNYTPPFPKNLRHSEHSPVAGSLPFEGVCGPRTH